MVPNELPELYVSVRVCVGMLCRCVCVCMHAGSIYVTVSLRILTVYHILPLGIFCVAMPCVHMCS